MSDEVRTYVTPMYPGFFFAEEGQSVRVDRESDAELVERFRSDEGWFCLEIVTRSWQQWTSGTQVKWQADPHGKQIKRRIYIGQVLDANAVAALPDDHGILLSNMRRNGWDRVVLTRAGNFQPLEKQDTVLAVAEVAR